MALCPVVGRLLVGLGGFQVGFQESPVHLGHESDADLCDRIRLLCFYLRHDLEHGRNGGDAGIEGLPVVVRELLTEKKKLEKRPTWIAASLYFSAMVRTRGDAVSSFHCLSMLARMPNCFWMQFAHRETASGCFSMSVS